MRTRKPSAKAEAAAEAKQTQLSKAASKAVKIETAQGSGELKSRSKGKKRAVEEEPPAVEEETAKKDVSSRTDERKKRQKAADVLPPCEQDDSCLQQVEAQISLARSPSKSNRKGKAPKNAAKSNAEQPSPACRPHDSSPVAPPPPETFDASNPEHISLCLSALNMEATAQEPAAANQQSLPKQPSTSTAPPHGRQQQFEQLHATLKSAWQDGAGRSVYISGLPGTGKSHTVRAVLRAMQQSQQGDEPLTVFVSCFGQTDAGHIHSAVLNHVARQAGQPAFVGSADSLPADQAYIRLHSYLQDLHRRPVKTGSGSGRSRMVVVVLDEVDRLLAARTGIDNMVKLFMLPHSKGMHCCVVAMANSIDITERCLPELKLRGCAPVFMPFGAYLRPQLLAILNCKLSSLPWTVFDTAALELLARKVAASTGDARKALQACRIALRALHEQHAGPNRALNLPLSPDAPPPPPTIIDLAPLNPPTSPRPPVPCTSPRSRRPLQVLDSQLQASADQHANPTPTRPGLPLATAGTPSRPPLSPLPSTLLDAAISTPGHTPGLGTTIHSAGQFAQARPDLVTIKEMVAALSRLSYQSDSSASTVATVRGLPQQQQLHILALASALATAATQAATEAAAANAAAEHGMSTTAYRAKYYWGPSVLKPTQTKLANPFAQAPAAGNSTGASTGAAGTSTGASVGTPSRMSVGATSCAGDAARAVSLSAAYDQYRALCLGLYQQPASEHEFHTTLQLLSHLGLVSVIQGAPGSATKGSVSTPGGGRRGGVSKAPGGLAGVQLLLKVAMKDIQAALKDNAVFRKVLAVLPNA